MIVWSHPSTGLIRRYAVKIAVIFTLFVALITTLFISISINAAPGINQTIGFQGRLLDSNGNVVPDGFYNVQFKIYQDGTGSTAGDDDGGTLKWTETYVNNNNSSGVEVKNGYLSVNLGSKTAFGSSIDWNQDTLWLSLNVAGKDPACTTFGTSPCVADGEMLPMKRLTASPYAINSSMLNGKNSSDFVQLGQGSQTDDSDNSSILIDKTGNGNLIQLKNNSTDVFGVANSGDIVFGSNDNHSVSVADSPADTAGMNLILAAGSGGSGDGADGGGVIISGGNGGGTDSNGGNITLAGGTGTGTGANGLIIMGTPTFSTVVDDANCYTSGATVASSCTISSSSINNSAAVIVGFSAVGQTATLPDPTLTTAGRVVYIMAANGSENFTLSMNGGGAGNELIMKADSATALIWNGSDWLVTGMSSSSLLGTSGTNDTPVVQVGSGDDDGSLTLLTVDKADEAPSVVDSSAMLGSIYYDTTLGALQCYESTGWGDCTSRPDSFVALNPEYSGAVQNGSNLGTMTSDICSDTLDINDDTHGTEVCGTDETYNFYNWTSSETGAQTRSIYVTYKLPSNFTEFVSESTYLMARTDSSDAVVTYQIYKNNGSSGLSPCGSVVSASTGVKTAWSQANATGTSDPSACGFEAGDSVVVQINFTSSNDANAYASTLGFAFSTH